MNYSTILRKIRLKCLLQLRRNGLKVVPQQSVGLITHFEFGFTSWGTNLWVDYSTKTHKHNYSNSLHWLTTRKNSSVLQMSSQTMSSSPVTKYSFFLSYSFDFKFHLFLLCWIHLQQYPFWKLQRNPRKSKKNWVYFVNSCVVVKCKRMTLWFHLLQGGSHLHTPSATA